MREIKFRVWDKITKKYFYSGTLDNGDVLVLHLDGEIEISSDDTYKPDDFIIEQFTGLRDKNGREIYEGDIVTVDGVLYFVEWRGAGDWFIDPECDDAFMFTPSIYELEIIGNIHENKELLP